LHTVSANYVKSTFFKKKINEGAENIEIC
jgi:hypothetical protein